MLGVQNKNWRQKYHSLEGWVLDKKYFIGRRSDMYTVKKEIKTIQYF